VEGVNQYRIYWETRSQKRKSPYPDLGRTRGRWLSRKAGNGKEKLGLSVQLGPLNMGYVQEPRNAAFSANGRRPRCRPCTWTVSKVKTELAQHCDVHLRPKAVPATRPLRESMKNRGEPATRRQESRRRPTCGRSGQEEAGTDPLRSIGELPGNGSVQHEAVRMDSHNDLSGRGAHSGPAKRAHLKGDA